MIPMALALAFNALSSRATSARSASCARAPGAAGSSKAHTTTVGKRRTQFSQSRDEGEGVMDRAPVGSGQGVRSGMTGHADAACEWMESLVLSGRVLPAGMFTSLRDHGEPS
jgi:hypothetical protein